jgi:hypothetical protein
VRWSLLLLLVLNLFYYVWHQQQAPIKGVEVAPLEQYQARQQDIRLLSESPALVASSAPKEIQSLIESSCMFLGGFETITAAETLRQRLVGLDIESVVKGFAAASELDYWVYLPPLASREASLRQLKELQARQIDSFIIAEGDLSNGISLGIFPRQESAVSVMGRLTEAGYEPALRKLARDQRSFWVRVAPASLRLLDESLLARLAEGFKDLRHELKPCEDIALGR